MKNYLYINEKNITTLEYIADTTKLVRKLDCGTIHILKTIQTISKQLSSWNGF
nr:hypothetical protein [Mycoplasmopsis bovis]